MVAGAWKAHTSWWLLISPNTFCCPTLVSKGRYTSFCSDISAKRLGSPSGDKRGSLCAYPKGSPSFQKRVEAIINWGPWAYLMAMSSMWHWIWGMLHTRKFMSDAISLVTSPWLKSVGSYGETFYCYFVEWSCCQTAFWILVFITKTCSTLYLRIREPSFCSDQQLVKRLACCGTNLLYAVIMFCYKSQNYFIINQPCFTESPRKSQELHVED